MGVRVWQSSFTLRGKGERFAARPRLEDLFSGVSDEATCNERIHRAVRVHHYTLKEVDDFLGLHSSTISVIAKRVGQAIKIQE